MCNPANTTNEGPRQVFVTNANVNIGQRKYVFTRVTEVACDPELGECLRRIERKLVARKQKCQELVQSKYSAIRKELPDWMLNHLCHLVLLTRDAVLVRHQSVNFDNQGAELRENPVLFQITDHSAVDECRLFSEQYVRLYLPGTDPPSLDDAPKFTMNIIEQDGTVKREVVTAHAAVNHPLSTPEITAPLPHRLVQTTGEFILELHGYEVDNTSKQERPMVVHTRQRMAVNWAAFEVFVPATSRAWIDIDASRWAEHELLEFVAANNVERQRKTSMDGRREGRNLYRSLLAEFDRILADATTEKPLQQFLEQQPSFLDPTKAAVFPQKQIGPYVTDFVIRHATGSYTLVELEGPTRRMFNSDGGQCSQLTRAIDQTVDWKRYLHDNLRTVQHELGLPGIDSSPHCLVIIGRDRDLSEPTRRKLQQMRIDRPGTTILTYDQLRAQTVAVVENLFGPIREESPRTELYFPESLPTPAHPSK